MKLLFVILGFVSFGIVNGQLSPNWTQEILDSVSNLNADIHGNIAHLNQQIAETLKGRLAHVDRLNKDMAKRLGKIAEETERLPKNGHTFVVNSDSGASRSVISGTDDDGQPYFRDSEDQVIDGVLHHSERIYNAKTNKIEEYQYTLDLNDPNAKPVPITKEQKKD